MSAEECEADEDEEEREGAEAELRDGAGMLTETTGNTVGAGGGCWVDAAVDAGNIIS